MRGTLFAWASVTILCACAAAAQPPEDSAWTGVWQGELDGQPAVTLTLADDGGALGGAVVFNLVERQEGGMPHVVSIQPHVLLKPQLNGTTLTFQIMRRDRSESPMQFTVALDGDGKAHIHCLNCGPDAPVAEIVKMQ
jgi:hypothetical protein